MVAFIQISITDHSKDALDGFTNTISNYPEVLECHHVTGDFDILLKIIVDSIEAYNHFLNEKISTLPNIGKTQSLFSLSQSKETKDFNIQLERN